MRILWLLLPNVVQDLIALQRAQGVHLPVLPSPQGVLPLIIKKGAQGSIKTECLQGKNYYSKMMLTIFRTVLDRDGDHGQTRRPSKYEFNFDHFV
jgi:hypothetical protein